MQLTVCTLYLDESLLQVEYELPLVISRKNMAPAFRSFSAAGGSAMQSLQR